MADFAFHSTRTTSISPSTDPVAFWETITPEVAGDWLARNVRNRPVHPREVTVLASSLIAGEWQPNGETIKFDVNGDLIDGQHRLLAIIQANVPAKALVVRGLPADTFATIDAGRKRSAGEMFALRGDPLGITVAAALGWLLRYETGRMRDRSSVLPTLKAFHLADARPGFIDAVAGGYPLYRKAPMKSRGLLGWLYYEFTQIDHDIGEGFFEALATGAELTQYDPILVLRERLVAEQRLVSNVPPFIQAAWTVKSWNAWRAGKEIRLLRFKPGEPFPKIAGRVDQPRVS